MKAHSIQSNRKGFTLVELLVVIAIIAVLAVVTFGVAGKMMKKSQQTTSMGNMRQIAILMNGYAAENNGKLPPPREENTGQRDSVANPNRPSQWHWHQAIIESAYPNVPYGTIMGDMKWWKTNKPIVMNPQFEKDAKFTPYWPGYAMNFKIGENVLKQQDSGASWYKQAQFRTHMSSIPDPARTPLIVPHWDWHSANFLSGKALNADARSDRFLIEGKLNVTFVDGHSELIRFADDKGKRLTTSEYAERELDKQPKL